MKRIAVLGCGMAGLAASRRLAQSGCCPILIAPVSDVPARGETLSGDACRLLAGLGWGDLLREDAALAGERRYSVWGSRDLRRAPQRAEGIHIDRCRLEKKMQASIGAKSVERVDAIALELEHSPNGVGINLSNGNRVDASAVIDCTGRSALSCGTAANRRRVDRLVAAYCILNLSEDDEIAAASLVEAVEVGWWYMAPMPGHRMILGLFSDADLLPVGTVRSGRLWELLSETIAVAARLDSLDLVSALQSVRPKVASASTIVATRVVDRRILRAGDAALSTDPLGANGLAAALWSGAEAADAALALVDGDPSVARSYEHNFLSGLASQLHAQHGMYAAECRFADAPFWYRRAHIQSPEALHGAAIDRLIEAEER